MQEAFVYIWIDARYPLYKFYIGVHNGVVNDSYTHSSTLFDKFTKNCIPKGIHRRILAKGSLEDMAKLEQRLLTNRKHRCWHRYYNIHTGGGKGWSIVNDNYDPEQRKQSSIRGGEAFKIKFNTDPDFAAEHIRKASDSSKLCHKDGRMKSIHEYYSWLGKKHTEETKKKMSNTHQHNEHQKGSTNSQYGTMWITDGIYSTKIKRDDSIPDGWKRGRTM